MTTCSGENSSTAAYVTSKNHSEQVHDSLHTLIIDGIDHQISHFLSKKAIIHCRFISLSVLSKGGWNFVSTHSLSTVLEGAEDD